MRTLLHLLAHLLLPGLVAKLGWRRHWLRAWGVLFAANLIDLDHLLANPVYDPSRCSIGFHPLHSGVAVCIYIIMVVTPGTRLLAVGLLLHLLIDGLDCLAMAG